MKQPPESVIFEIEEAIIAYALVDDAGADTVVSNTAPGDFSESLFQTVWERVAALRADGHTASASNVAEGFAGEEINPGATYGQYLKNLATSARLGEFEPLAVCVERLKRDAARRALVRIGSHLSTSAIMDGSSLKQISQDAASGIDDVLSSIRIGKRRSYSAEGLGSVALEHMDSDEVPYPTTGLPTLDLMIRGWPRGELSVLAARPGMGKSAFAICSSLGAARENFPTLFFSLEMTSEQVGARMLTDLAYTKDNPIWYERILSRRISSEHEKRRLREASAKLKGLDLRIEQQRGLTISEIASRSRKEMARLEAEGKRLELIVVDHMLKVQPTQRYSGNRVREVAEISEGLAKIADELDVSMLALCQLNRAVEGRDNHRPSLSDLRDSGAIEEDASLVAMLYRPAYYLKKPLDDPDADLARQEMLEAKKNFLEVSVVKNRNGRDGVLNAYIDVTANAIRWEGYEKGTPRPTS